VSRIGEMPGSTAHFGIGSFPLMEVRDLDPAGIMFFALSVSRSCWAPQPSHVHCLTTRCLRPLGPVRASQLEQPRVVLTSETTNTHQPAWRPLDCSCVWHAPAGIQHGLRHPGLHQLQAAHIAYVDVLVSINNLPREHVQSVLTPASGAPVQALGLALVRTTLCLCDFPLDPAIGATGLQAIGVAGRRGLLQAQINAHSPSPSTAISGDMSNGSHQPAPTLSCRPSSPPGLRAVRLVRYTPSRCISRPIGLDRDKNQP
jgi:hypothetical protein